MERPGIVRTNKEQAEYEDRRPQHRRDYNQRRRAGGKVNIAASDSASAERWRVQVRVSNRRRRAQATIAHSRPLVIVKLGRSSLRASNRRMRCYSYDFHWDEPKIISLKEPQNMISRP